VLILDAFHDTITDRVYDEFEKRGLLKSKPGKTLISLLSITITAIVIAVIIAAL